MPLYLRGLPAAGAAVSALTGEVWASVLNVMRNDPHQRANHERRHLLAYTHPNGDVRSLIMHDSETQPIHGRPPVSCEDPTTTGVFAQQRAAPGVEGDIQALMTKPEFPRSSGYDIDWMLANQMGPNALWLMEWLCETVTLTPGMRVLDLGCGKGMTSIFLAREFGVRVWATDLWIGPDNNWLRAKEAGVHRDVYPLRCEAHALPFASGFFDAVVSVDAYQYFGTNDLYLNYLAGFVRPGGAIGVVVPGLTQPVDQGVPAHLLAPQKNGKPFWEDDCACFHTASWWHERWAQIRAVRGVTTDVLPDGWRHWRDFDRALELADKNLFPSDAEALERDKGQTIGFVRVRCERTNHEVMNLNDPTIGVRVGIDTFDEELMSTPQAVQHPA